MYCPVTSLCIVLFSKKWPVAPVSATIVFDVLDSAVVLLHACVLSLFFGRSCVSFDVCVIILRELFTWHMLW